MINNNIIIEMMEGIMEFYGNYSLVLQRNSSFT